MAKATDADIKAHAEKHGISEESVRDILGIAEPKPIVIEAEQYKTNPAKVRIHIDPTPEGPVIVDAGDGNGFVEHEPNAKGQVTLEYAEPGSYKVRLDLGGTVRWVDVEAGVDPNREPETRETLATVGSQAFPEMAGKAGFDDQGRPVLSYAPPVEGDEAPEGTGDDGEAEPAHEDDGSAVHAPASASSETSGGEGAEEKPTG